MSIQDELNKLRARMLGDAARVERGELSRGDVAVWLIPEYAARLEAIAKAAQEPVAPHEQPFAYAYEYPYHLLAHGLNTIRFTNGEPINGYAPIRTVPVYTRPQPESAQALVEALEQIKLKAGMYEAVVGNHNVKEMLSTISGHAVDALAAHKSEVKG